MQEGQFKNSDFDQAFGELISVHRARFEWITVLWVFFALVLLVPGLGILSEHYLGGSVCIACSLPFFYLAWMQFANRRDELRIYQNGFTYTSRNDIQTCLWSEAASFSFTTSMNHNYTEKVSDIVGESIAHELTGVIKTNGRHIEFREGIIDPAELIAKAKASKSKRAKKRREPAEK